MLSARQPGDRTVAVAVVLVSAIAILWLIPRARPQALEVKLIRSHKGREKGPRLSSVARSASDPLEHVEPAPAPLLPERGDDAIADVLDHGWKVLRERGPRRPALESW
jgi:hypothetical protein